MAELESIKIKKELQITHCGEEYIESTSTAFLKDVCSAYGVEASMSDVNGKQNDETSEFHGIDKFLKVEMKQEPRDEASPTNLQDHGATDDSLWSPMPDAVPAFHSVKVETLSPIFAQPDEATGEDRAVAEAIQTRGKRRPPGQTKGGCRRKILKADNRPKESELGPISEEILPDYVNSDIDVANCQQKRKSLRDYCRRKLARKRKGKCGSGATGRKQYVFFDQLRCLKKVVQPSARSIDEEDVENGKSANERGDETTPIKKKAMKRRASANRDTAEDGQLMNVLKAKCCRRETQEESKDADTLFVLSLVPELRKLPEYLKLKTKEELFNVLRKARMQCAPSTSTSTYTNPRPGVPNIRPAKPFDPAHSYQGILLTAFNYHT